MSDKRDPAAKKDELKPFVIRMPADLHQAIKSKAAAEERSMAQTIRHALRIYTGESSA